MRRVFFDTSTYVAITDKDDQFHGQAVALVGVIAEHRLPRVTTNYVLAETYTRIRRKMSHAAAVQFGDSIRRDQGAGRLEVVYAHEALDDKAWSLFKQYADQRFSFVDCVSFAWLRQNPHVEAFAFDSHFLQMGIAPFQ